ncbi:MAG: hypothetical protein JXR59_05495 [Desulfuromonadaceae bacterium]|nr:hypothetical protein [Desulfuromonadaceae bacterium]
MRLNRIGCTLLLISLISLISLSGCGKKGPVVPLKEALPKAPQHLALSQKGTALLLGWEIPTLNQDGTPLEDLKEFAIYKTDYALEKGCPECRTPNRLLRSIDVAWYHSSHPDSRRLYLWDSAVEEDTGYRYRIVPLNSNGHAGADVTIHRPCYLPPPPPVAVQGEGHDRQVLLRWQETLPAEGEEEWLGYNIYRRSGDSYFGVQPLNDKPLAATYYEDLTVENNRSYDYAVRSVIRVNGFIVESALSSSVTVRPLQTAGF